jgi:hypothetical protein
MSWVSGIAALHWTQVKSAMRVDVWTLLPAVVQTHLFKKLIWEGVMSSVARFSLRPVPCALRHNLIRTLGFCWLVWAVWQPAAAGAVEIAPAVLLAGRGWSACCW